jgi:hypothetical protein
VEDNLYPMEGQSLNVGPLQNDDFYIELYEEDPTVMCWASFLKKLRELKPNTAEALAKKGYHTMSDNRVFDTIEQPL